MQDIMSTLENFQLGEVPAAPSNHHDCDVRPVQVDLRYQLCLATPLLPNLAVIQRWVGVLDPRPSALKVFSTAQVFGCGSVR